MMFLQVNWQRGWGGAPRPS